MPRLPRTLAVAAFLLTSGFGECQHEDAFNLARNGYTMLSPPSNLFSPGAIVMMQLDDRGQAQLKLTCGPRGNLGPRFMARVSETMSSTYKMSSRQRLSLEAEAVDRFRSRTSVDEVSSVTVSLTNPRVVEVDEASIVENVQFRSEACAQAIQMRQDAGYRPTFVTSAYIADVEYDVHFKNETRLSKRAKEDKMAKIAAKLGGGHTEVRQSSMRAVNLTIALKTDEWLLQIQPGTPKPNAASNSPRALNAPFAEALPGSDSPLVAPEGGWVNPVIGG